MTMFVGVSKNFWVCGYAFFMDLKVASKKAKKAKKVCQITLFHSSFRSQKSGSFYSEFSVEWNELTPYSQLLKRTGKSFKSCINQRMLEKRRYTFVISYAIVSYGYYLLFTIFFSDAADNEHSQLVELPGERSIFECNILKSVPRSSQLKNIYVAEI